jgi:signal transduction histidine kinase
MAQSNDRKKGKKKTSRPTPAPAAGTNPSSSAEDVEKKLLEVTKVNRQLKRKIFDLYTIFEISRNFTAVLDYKTLLDSFIFTCLGQVGVLRGSIFLKDSLESKEFRLAEAKGSGDLPGPDACFRDDTRLSRYLTRLNRPVFVANLSPDLTTDSERELLSYFEGGLIVPLIYKPRLAGLFALADKLSQREFNPDEIEFVSALGNQISVAIENARLYEAEKSANEQLWAAQRQLVRAERLGALGEMSAKIAHEVNNPLGIIKNYLLLMSRDKDDRRKSKEYVDIVSQEIDRIAMIVDEMREYQRPTGIEFSAVDVHEVLGHTLALTERQLQASGISLIRRMDDRSMPVSGNADRLRQVFLNLILNARAAMDDEGDLVVELTSNAGDVIVRFFDTGPGIAPEIIPRIFEPFFTTKKEGGSGLGLSICHGIIKSHKGSITFRNTENGGCFEILLPLVEE